MGPGDSKLLCGPITIIEGKERSDSKGKEKARKAQKLRLHGVTFSQIVRLIGL